MNFRLAQRVLLEIDELFDNFDTYQRHFKLDQWQRPPALEPPSRERQSV